MRKPNNKRGLVVEVRDDNINVALRRFKRKIDESGKLMEVVAGQFYEKPTTERKRKAGAAKSRWKKKLKEQQLPKKLY
jgi:small subunit ribosomal protein S21